jgi:hypothetical protein
MRSPAFFAAITPASSAIRATSPLAVTADIARVVLTRPRATAERSVSALAETSTMRGRPDSSK